MPERVQLRRQRGWRMPPGTVKVDRSTRWGNPFQLKPGDPAARVVNDYRQWITGAPEMRRDGIAPEPPSLAEVREHLHGRNLGCWCPLGTPCHADVLLEIANEQERL